MELRLNPELQPQRKLPAVLVQVCWQLETPVEHSLISAGRDLGMECVGRACPAADTAQRHTGGRAGEYHCMLLLHHLM